MLIFVVYNDDSKSLHLWDSIPVKEFDRIAPSFIVASVGHGYVPIISAALVKNFCGLAKSLKIGAFKIKFGLPESPDPTGAQLDISVICFLVYDVLLKAVLDSRALLLLTFQKSDLIDILLGVLCFNNVFLSIALAHDAHEKVQLTVVALARPRDEVSELCAD